MKKRFVVYAIIWALCLAVFNVIVFVSPNELDGMSKFDGMFWVGYIYITVSFVVQLVCAMLTLSQKTYGKLLYRVPLISISYTGVVLMLTVGAVCMAIPQVPTWFGIIICTVIVVFNVIAIVKAEAAAEIVGAKDGDVKRTTFFIKDLTNEAQSLLSAAASDSIHAEAKRVYELLRYSDPVSTDALNADHAQIAKQFKVFSDSVHENDSELARKAADELAKMIECRNQKCKLLK